MEKLNNNLDKQLADILSQRDSISKIKFNDLIKNINKTQIKKIPQIKISNTKSGFLYYGVYKDRKWTEINFKNLTRQNQLPQVGDEIISICPINIREKEIQYTKENGWINQKYLGTLDEGSKIKINKVIKVVDNYVWIQFKNN